MLEERQERQRAFIREAMTATGLDATNLARRAKLSPSTLNRFLNKPIDHLLSGQTLAKISAVSGVQVPADVSAVVAPVVEPTPALLPAPSVAEADLYDRAVKTVRRILGLAGYKDRELETKIIAEFYHELKSGGGGD